MRAIVGSRPPVAKLIEESLNITDSDVLMQYIRGITRFYSSEYKTSSEILNQFKKDIKDIVQSYKLASSMSFQEDIRGLSKSLDFLMYETANMGIFLDNDSLLSLELDKVLLSRPIEQIGEEWGELDGLIKEFGEEKGFMIFRKRYSKGSIKPMKILRNVYDCTIVYYEIRNSDYPKIPEDLKNLFPNESQCVDFVRRYYGKPAKFVANAYLGESGVTHPSDTNKSIPVVSILFRYFVEPFVEKNRKESARTGFYKLFRI